MRVPRWFVSAAILLGLGVAPQACKNSGPNMGAESTDDLWSLIPRLRESPYSRISQSEVVQFWGGLGANPTFSAAVRSLLGPVAGGASLYPSGDAGRSLLIDRTVVTLYVRAWHLTDLDGVSVISYALTWQDHLFSDT